MENAGTKFNTHGLSDEFVEQLFHDYVFRNISVDDDSKVPVCPFETCGECNTAYSDGCYSCGFENQYAIKSSGFLRSMRRPQQNAP